MMISGAASLARLVWPTDAPDAREIDTIGNEIIPDLRGHPNHFEVMTQPKTKTPQQP